jgi:hypothetical protein
MTLELDPRACKQGVSLNTRWQKHGEEKLPAKDIRLLDVPISKSELNDFFQNANAWNMLYVERKGKPPEPFWSDKIPSFDVPGKWRKSSASLSFGLKPYSVSFGDSVLSRVSLACTTGGITLMSLTISCLKSNIRGDLAMLDDYLDATMRCEVEFGEEGPGDDDGDDDDDQDELDLEHDVPPNKKPGENEISQQLAKKH